MLLFRERIPADWLPKVKANLPAVLVDHAHLERKAATTALNLEKFRQLFGQVHELNAIAIEELQHFELVLQLLRRRGIPFTEPRPSAWIKGLMRAVRGGIQGQVIDHLLCCALIEARSCEKFQVLGEALEVDDPELASLRDLSDHGAPHRLGGDRTPPGLVPRPRRRAHAPAQPGTDPALRRGREAGPMRPETGSAVHADRPPPSTARSRIARKNDLPADHQRNERCSAISVSPSSKVARQACTLPALR